MAPPAQWHRQRNGTASQYYNVCWAETCWEHVSRVNAWTTFAGGDYDGDTMLVIKTNVIVEQFEPYDPPAAYECILSTSYRASVSLY